VGAQDGMVTIFSGLPQDVGPLGLSRVVSQEDVLVSDLPAVYRERVEATYSASDLADAERIVGVLRTEALTSVVDQGTAEDPSAGTGATPSATPTTGTTAPGASSTAPTATTPAPATS